MSFSFTAKNPPLTIEPPQEDTQQPSGERTLADRLKKRDPQAMADLYDQYGRIVYSIIFRTTRDSAAAEDLVQETFLRIWNSIQRFDSARGGLGAWITAVARNRALDYLRSVQCRQFREAVSLDAAAAAGSESDPVDLDRTRMLGHALKALTDRQRHVIVLSFREGLSHREIADRLRQPLGTVKTRIRAALELLRNTIEPEAAGCLSGRR